MNNHNAEPTNQPLSKDGATPFSNSQRKNCVGETRKIPVCENNEQTMEVLREEKQLRFCPWMNKQQEGRENWKCVSLQHSRRGKGRIYSVSEVNRGGVCMWVRTDSPATPPPKQLTASTTSSNSSMKVVGINKVRKTHGFWPHWLKLDNSPTSLSL